MASKILTATEPFSGVFASRSDLYFQSWITDISGVQFNIVVSQPLKSAQAEAAQSVYMPLPIYMLLDH